MSAVSTFCTVRVDPGVCTFSSAVVATVSLQSPLSENPVETPLVCRSQCTLAETPPSGPERAKGKTNLGLECKSTLRRSPESGD